MHLPGTGRGTASRRLVVEGLTRVTRRNNGQNCIVQVRKYMPRRQSQDRETELAQELVPAHIARSAVGIVIHHAINLYYQPSVETDKIQHHVAKRVLSTELVA